MLRSSLTRTLLALFMTLCFVQPSAANDTQVDVELVLAVDVSLSMDSYEQQLQLQGYVEAFGDRQVLRAIEIGPHKKIAVIFVEWGAPFRGLFSASISPSIIDWIS